MLYTMRQFSTLHTVEVCSGADSVFVVMTTTRWSQISWMSLLNLVTLPLFLSQANRRARLFPFWCFKSLALMKPLRSSTFLRPLDSCSSTAEESNNLHDYVLERELERNRDGWRVCATCSRLKCGRGGYTL